ncbi:MAG: hypothetical protein ABI472_03345 [Ginsengibacter sp.]
MKKIGRNVVMIGVLKNDAPAQPLSRLNDFEKVICLCGNIHDCGNNVALFKILVTQNKIKHEVQCIGKYRA